MSFSTRLQEIRTGFERPFWVANFTELFERLAYYGAYTVLAVYLNEQMHFSKELTSSLAGFFGFVVWFLPIVGGTLADRFGFRRSLMAAYLIMTIGYFLMGSLSAPWMQTIRTALGDKWLVLVVLLIPAMGPAIVKPCVAGTTARASNERVRSIGFSIYYTLVNVGGTLGPLVAGLVSALFGWGFESVFRISAVSVFAMFLVTLLFFREPAKPGEQKVASVAEAFKNFFFVLRNFRFVLFLFIWSIFFVVFWQEFVSFPVYIRSYVNPHANFEFLLSVDALTVICFQVLIAFLVGKMKAFPTMTLGLAVSSCSWLIAALFPTTVGFIATLVVLATGEMIQTTRYYEYISNLAPSGQQGLYMGFAFLPIAIGNIFAGLLGGYLLHYFGDVLHRPSQMWWVVTAVGFVGVILMIVYDRIFKPGKGEAKTA